MAKYRERRQEGTQGFPSGGDKAIELSCAVSLKKKAGRVEGE